VLELSAKTSACEHPDKACHGASCPLAQGFYDRLPLAREVALASGLILDKEAVRAVALQQGICPYYLAWNWRAGATSSSATTIIISTSAPCCTA
jgi:hypothetical protein